MTETTLLLTNITNIVLIGLFLFYRWKVKVIEETRLQHQQVLSELCIQSCNIICICARQDYHLNKIPIGVLIDIIMQQPLHPQQKFSHFQMAGITMQDLADRGIDHVFKDYFKMGEEKDNQTTNG